MGSFQKRKIFIYGTLVILALAVFGVGFMVGKNQVVCKVCKPETIDFSLFWDAYNKLNENYIDPAKVNDADLIYGAISGMTKSLGDPYTDFFKPEQAKIFQQDLKGSFDGVGIEIGIKNEALTVISPLRGSPAEKAGILAGDVIVAVDGKPTADMAIEEVIGAIRGKKGTEVVLSIFRNGWEKPKDFAITRYTIKIDSVSWQLKGSDVAYIQVHQFSQALPADFSKVAKEILESQAKKIVLDLRNNPGGYLEVCQEVASWFLRKNEVITIEDFGADKEQVLYKSEGSGLFLTYPTVILINKGSASASEILAGALRDNRGIKLIGEKSFGKGSVQEVISLQNGISFLKITVAKWLTPKGVYISDFGLTPDIAVGMGDGIINSESDAQLAKALEIVNDLR